LQGSMIGGDFFKVVLKWKLIVTVFLKPLKIIYVLDYLTLGHCTRAPNMPLNGFNIYDHDGVLYIPGVVT
jgi:hypothetical protein